MEHSQQRRQPDAATKGVAVVQGAGRASTRELLQQREETRPDSMSPTSSSCAGAIPSIAGSSRGRSRSPRRLKKRDDTEPPAKKTSPQYVFKGSPVPYSEKPFVFEEPA